MKPPEFKWIKNLDWPKLAKITFGLIFIYIIIIFGISLFKYFNYLYNGLDLAIFNQVFYNSSYGRLFEFSIHPTSYLGDHFELIIFFLLPFYTLWRSPLNLLLLQACFLGFTAIPVYLLAKKHLTPQLGLLVILLYIFNPLTFNIAVYEFHILALAPFFLAWTFYFYDQNKFWPFLAFCALSLLVREDVSFVIILFGLVALLDKKKLPWILAPSFLGSAYFFMILKLAPLVSSMSAYKFLAYYYWLGQSPAEIFINFFTKYQLVIRHVANVQNLELILGFFLVFLFIPIWRPKYLLLCLGNLMQLLLAAFATGATIKGHYGSIYLIVFTIATIFSLKALQTNSKFQYLNREYSGVLPTIFIGGLIYLLIVLGPLPCLANTLVNFNYKDTPLKQEFVSQIPENSSVITTYDLITNLSSRKYVYPLNYTVIGRQQFNAGDYLIPDSTQYLLIDFSDYITFHLQFAQKYPDYYYQIPEKLSNLLKEKNFKLIKITRNLALWQKSDQPDNYQLYSTFTKEELPQISAPQNQNLQDKLEFLGSNLKQNQLSLFFKVLAPLEQNYFIKIDGQIYPLGYGFYPTHNWQVGETVQINFFDLDPIKKAEIISFDGMPGLNGIGSITWDFDHYEKIGELNF
ncbi:MAG: DUF2079 domain-containing protein [Candidatus Parcubacteria bacterium]|nr:DUF2079 domain-containing protein [Candidatus Parcubacteria bacterium]